MSSRIRSDVDHIFECFCEVSRLKGGKDPTIVNIFPENFRNDFLKWIPDFTFPCKIDINAVQHFSFALTSLDSTWTYGFCRHEPYTQKALVIVSHFPYHDAFYELLDFVADLIRCCKDVVENSPAHSSKPKMDGVLTSVSEHLQKFYNKPVPLPQPHKLPTLPDNINLTEYYCAMDFDSMVAVLASLLHERRIMMVSRKLSRLSACIQAANQLIYPLEWQGIYIPILPMSLKDCLLAPMPYLIGVPYPVYEGLPLHDIGDVVTVNVDDCTVNSPFDDVGALPQEVVEDLLSTLQSCKNLGDALARAFLQTLVHLLGGIENAIRFDGPRPHFDKEAFVTSRGSGVQPFLREMLTLQMFQQFLEGRMAVVAAKAGCSDEFARECCAWEENVKRRRKWQRNPAKILKTIKHKTQPAMESAIKTVRSGNKGMKSAYKGLKNKLVVAKRTLGGSSGTIGGSEWWERPSGSQDSSCSSEPVAKMQPQTLVNETTPQDIISLTSGDDRPPSSSQRILCMESYGQEEDKLLRESEERFFSLLDSTPSQAGDMATSATFSSPQTGYNKGTLLVPELMYDSESDDEPFPRHSTTSRKSDILYERRKTQSSLLAELLDSSPGRNLKPRHPFTPPALPTSRGSTPNKPFVSVPTSSFHLPPPQPERPKSVYFGSQTPTRTIQKIHEGTQEPTVCPLVLAGLADNDGISLIGARIQEDELLKQYGINFEKFRISRQNWTKFE